MCVCVRALCVCVGVWEAVCVRSSCVATLQFGSFTLSVSVCVCVSVYV